MLGKISPLLVVLVTLLVPAFAPLATGEHGTEHADALVVNGSFELPPEKSVVKAVRKSLGLFQSSLEANGRLAGQGISFTAGDCGTDGACIRNLSAGGSAAPAVAEFRMVGTPATLDVRSSTTTLASDAGLVHLAAAAPGIATIEATTDLALAITLPEGGAAASLGPGRIAFHGGGPTLTLLAPGATFSATGRDVTLTVPAGGKALLVGAADKGIGAVPGADAPALLAAERLGAYVTAARVDGTPHATVADLSGRVAEITLADGRLTATVESLDATGTIYAFDLAAGLLAPPQPSTFTILVDGKLPSRVDPKMVRDEKGNEQRVENPEELWTGTDPVAMTAYATKDGSRVLVVVPGGVHTIDIHQAPKSPLDPATRVAISTPSPTGIAGSSLVGSFDGSSPTDLQGRFLAFSLARDGEDTVLRDLAYPGKATPLFSEVRISGGGDAALSVDASTATLDSGAARGRLHDGPSAWFFIAPTRDTTITFTPADGTTVDVGAKALVARYGTFHVHVVRAPDSPEVAKASGAFDSTLDGATGAVSLALTAGERILVAAHPDFGANMEEYHALVGLFEAGAVEGLRETNWDEFEGETSHWVGASEEPQAARYENGVAQFKLRASSPGGRIVVLDLSPEFYRAYSPASFTVNYDGADLAPSTATSVFDLNALRRSPVVLTATEEGARAVVYLPDDAEHTVTILQHQPVKAEDPGATFLAFMILATAVGLPLAWFVARRYEA